MKTALEQAYLAREQLLNEVEGASESSRTALSAISGQELRKAERETEKIERDKEIAGQRVDAIIEQGNAEAAIDLEQTKATIALQDENRRKNEAVAMIKLGVYDPSFAGVLGMQDNVIKKVAENKAREIEAAKARARAAAQAKADYEASLAGRGNQGYTKNHNKYKDLSTEDKAAIEKIVQENGNSADYTNVEKLVDFQMTSTSVTPAGRIANSTKTAEKADIMQKQGRAYARELIAESIYKKRGSDLTSLENSYKSTFNFKLEEAMDGMFNATTQAEYNSAQTLFEESVKIADERTAEILEVISDAYKKGVNLSAEDLYKVKAQREDLNSLRLALTSMMKREGVSDETKGIINEMTVEIDDVIFTLDAAEKYSREYDPESEEIRFRQLDYKYGDHVDELLAKEVPNSVKAKSDNVWERVVTSVTPEPAVDHNKTLTKEEWEYLQLRGAVKTKEKKDLLEKEFGGFSAAELRYISADNVSLNADGEPWADFVPSKEAESARKRYAAMKRSGSISDADMMIYISERNKIATQNDKDAFFAEVLALAPGKTNAEKYRFAQKVFDEISVLNNTEFGILTPEQKKFFENVLTAAGEKYGIENPRYSQNQNSGQYAVYYGYNTYAPLEELERDMKEYYGRISTSGIVEKYSDSKIDANVSKEFIENAIDGFDYVLGSGPYSGWFFDFESDLKRFAEGDYGYFRVDEGERILTVLKKEGANAAFDYYAAVREGALERQAEDWFGDAAWIPGLFSGLTKFTTDGHFMLWNALSGSNKTISGDVFSAAHQITMKDFAESDSGWNQFGELAYMAGYSIVDMAPAVALSYVPYAGPYLSSAYIYAKSLGTTYTDAIKQGKTTSEAMTFATMTAASEVLMEKAIGGITKLGGSGSLTNKLTSVIEKLAVRQGVKTAMNVAVKMGAEGFEEFLQEVLSPFYATVADALNGTDEIESNEVDWEAAFQSFAIGALTGGAFGVVDIRTENNARADYLSHVAIERGDAIKIINKAAELGNKRAKRVLDAIENNSPLRKGKEGLYQYVSDHDITNMRKSIRNRSKRKIVQGIEHELAQIEGRDHSKDGEIVQVFRDLLGNRSVDVAQIALLLNDPAALEILNRMLGEDVGALMPHEALALARLAAFVGTDGKVDKARIEAFRDAYGRLDYKAIAEMQRFEEMEERAILKAMEGDDRYRVVFQKESDYSKVKKETNESLEELKRLSEASSVIFYVSDQYKTGTYLATNVMAIKSDDISKAAYYTMGKKAYYMTLRLDPEKAAVIKGFLLAEIENMIGTDGIIAEKEKLRQQGVDEEMLEDELCARMMPAVFLRGNYKAAEELAASDSEAAEKMCLALDSIRRYINGNINTKNEAVLAKKEISPVDFKMNERIAPYFEELSKEDPNHKGGCEKIIKKMAKDLGITGRRYSTPELDFDFSFGQNGLAESLHNQNYYGGDYVDFAKVIANLEKVLDNATLIEEHSDKYSGKIKEDTELLRVYVMMSLLQDGNTVIPVQLEIKRRIDGKSVLYVAVAAKKIEVDVAGKNGSQAVGNGETLLSTSKYSISEIFKKINTSDERFLKYVPGSFLSANQSVAKNNALNKSESDVDKLENKKHYENRGVNKELMELYDRLTEALDKHYEIQRAVGADFDPSVDVEGSSFVYTDSNTARKKIETKIEQFQKENDLTPDEIKYCERVAKGGPIVEVQDTSRAEIYDELIRMYMDLEVPESSAEYDQARFENMTEEEKERWLAERQSELDGYMQAVVDFADPIAKEERPDPADSVMTEVSQRKTPPKEALKKGWNWWRRKWTDSGATVYDIAKEVDDPALYHYYNAARASTNSAIYMVLNKQTDICGKTVGKGLNEIFRPVMARGDYHDFQLYLLHMHNVDRMSRQSQQAMEQADAEFQIVVEAYPELSKYTDNEIRKLAFTADGELQLMAQDYMAALKNKEYWESVQNVPVFGPHVTAEDSRLQAQMLLQKHPEFKEMAEEVYQYSRNLLQYRVDSGLITKEFSNKLQKIYPHYVPTARDESASGDNHISGVRADRVQVGRSIRRLKDGGVSKIIPLHKQFADQTMAVVREGAKNRFGMRLLELGKKDITGWPIKKIENVSDRILPVVTFEGQIDMVDPFVTEEFKNVFAVYLNGEQYNMEVTEDLFEAIKALAPDKEASNVWIKIGRGSVDLYKKLITAYNPAFAIRNFARDMQDALFYSKDLKGFIKNYLPAIQEIKNNGEYWQQYQALGGTYSSIYNFDTGTEVKRGKAKKLIGRIENINMMIEQLPRFAEFMATVKKGDGKMENLMEAMYNAADITTNFGRSGKYGKFLNRTVVPFFNPGVQGFSKAVRMFTETKGARAWASLVIKAAVLGFAPALLNGLLYGDDEEWEIINQRDKDVNYLFKIGDGLWLKIPKGRVLSVLGMSADRIVQVSQGEDVEWGEYFTTVGDQVAPANPLTANVLAGIMSVGYNKTWYGGDIVSASMQNLPAEEQYDAQTDIVSVWLGDLLNVSPKKINYILDQYTGVAGDIILPALSVAEERGFLEKSFTIDTDYSNRLSGDFYDRLQDLTEKKNSVNGTAVDEAKYRWWNKKADELSLINKDIKAIQEDGALSRDEKKERLDVLYASKTAFILAAEADYDEYVNTVDKVAKRVELAEDDAADIIFRESNREMFGAEAAIEIYSKQTYERAVEVRDERGIDFETFYDVYFDDSVSNEQTFNLIEGGIGKEEAMKISRSIQNLEPEAGEENVSYLQKYRAINETDIGEGDKLKAMDILASDADRRRVKIGADYDISLDLFINVKGNIEYLNDLDGKQTASNAKIEAAIDHEEGLTKRQRAILWQLFTSSDSAKNNPFSVSIGWEIAAKIKAYKAAEE